GGGLFVEHIAARERQHFIDLFERPSQRGEHTVELYLHLHRQRPARDVIGRDRRTAGILEVVRMILRLEHVENVRAVGLVAGHEERTGRVWLPGDLERAGGTMNLHTIFEERVDEARRGGKVGLVA